MSRGRDRVYAGEKKGLRCPECGSNHLTNDGFMVADRKWVQRYLCHNCLRRTIYPKGGKK